MMPETCGRATQSPVLSSHWKTSRLEGGVSDLGRGKSRERDRHISGFTRPKGVVAGALQGRNQAELQAPTNAEELPSSGNWPPK